MGHLLTHQIHGSNGEVCTDQDFTVTMRVTRASLPSGWCCLLSPLLFRASLSLLFSLPNIHYSSPHSSLARLCPLPPFSSSAGPPYLHSQPRLAVPLSRPCPRLPPQYFFPTAQGRAFHEHWPDRHTMFALSWEFRAKQEQGHECPLWPWLAVSKPHMVLCV